MKVLASSIVNKYGTRDPYKLCKLNDILIIQEPLGNIQGYYNNVDGQKFIHVNDKLPEYYQSYVIAHMLYRVFTNPEEMLFLKRKTAKHFTESERLANAFALNLAFPKRVAEIKTNNFLYLCGLSDNDIEDLFNRLYRVWDPKHTMNRDDLFRFVIDSLY